MGGVPIQRLLLVSGTYGQIAREHKTEFETVLDDLVGMAAQSLERATKIRQLLESRLFGKQRIEGFQIPEGGFRQHVYRPFLDIGIFHRYAMACVRSFDEDPRAWADEVRVPTLFVWGGKDDVVHSGQSEAALRRLPNAGSIYIADGDHYLLSRDNAELFSRVFSFLEGEDTPSVSLRADTPDAEASTQ
jgi:pimeloyl-ACP methyl ester carboxylesterase